MFPAIILDRDGVIIENRAAYVRSWSDVEIYPQALNALVRVSDSPYKIVIVTNQAGVGRGLITHEAVEEINRRLIAKIGKAGGRIDGVFVCPHSPEDGCNCRKPRPGMLLESARVLSLDLSRSFMIGDALSDIQAGQSAGVKQAILVRTGRGAEQAESPYASDLKPFLVFDTLAEALAAIIP